jgi:hypothetical protein
MKLKKNRLKKRLELAQVNPAKFVTQVMKRG